MIASHFFKVIHWNYERIKSPTKIKTDSTLGIFSLCANVDKKVVGLCFRWTLRLKAKEGDILSYISEENYLISDPGISLSELKDLARKTYDKSKLELEMRNFSVGLDASFPPFDDHLADIDLSDILLLLKS